MVEIFRTNVNNDLVAHQIMDKVKSVYEDADVSFDLDDCDRVFRFCLAADKKDAKEFISILFESLGYTASALDDDLSYSNVQNPIFLSTNNVGINMFLSFI